MKAADPQQRCRVVLVEDEASIRTLLETMLRNAGHEVVAALGPAEALTWLTACLGDYDLLITDITMPDINGVQLAARIRAARPGLPVLFISGYSQVENDEILFNDENSTFLGKPFKARDLLAAVGRLWQRSNKALA